MPITSLPAAPIGRPLPATYPTHTSKTTAWIALLLIVTAGMVLRLDQFATQVLLDDEWHAIHQILRHSPWEMFKTFGRADYSIPLGLLYNWLANHLGLSETLMRLPMMVAGCLLLLLFPVYIARRLGWPIALLWAILLAMSPLLLTYSRMARPYGLTVLLTWIAHAAFLSYWQAPSWRKTLLPGISYVISSALAIWLHLITGPFIAAPFFWGLWRCLRGEHDAFLPRKILFIRLMLLGVCFTLITLALIAYPLINDAQSLSSKSGMHLPTLTTLTGMLYLYFGSESTWSVVLCTIVALIGIPRCWTLPIVRTGTLGIGLTVLAILLTRPDFIFNSVTFVRYVLPGLPLCLLFLATGCATLAHLSCAHRKILYTPVFIVTAAIPLLTSAATSPLHQILRSPNSNSLGIFFVFEYRPWKNIILPQMSRILPSDFWRQQATQPPNTQRIAVAPFSFESYNWNGALWEHASHQQVIPAFLNGFCAQARPGELLASNDLRFHFHNAVFLDNPQEFKSLAIDWIVWMKTSSQAIISWEPTNAIECEAKWRTTFGTPDYEDALLMAYHVSKR